MSVGHEEIPDADHESVIERVCAIDVAKATGKVCLRVPHPAIEGRRVSRVWDVPATLAAVTELATELVVAGVQRVTVESTSDYWRIWFYVLEAAGLQVQLVNARDVKNVPGRPKTDKLDAVWLAKLTEKGMLRPSFVPPAQVRQLRDYTRLRIDLTRERTRHWQRLEKLLEDALIKVSAVASTITAMSVRDMLEALIGGERDPHRLADLARGKMRSKRGVLAAALTGRFDAHHAVMARVLLNQIDALTAEIADLDEHINGQLAAITTALPESAPADAVTVGVTGLQAVQRLSEVTGIGVRTAQIIIAEIGMDMTKFPTAAHLVSWAKLSPRTVQSGAVVQGGRTGQGNPYLKGALGEAAAVAARTDTFLGERYRRLVKRRGKLKALVAIARSLLVIVWNLLADPRSRYHDLGPDHFAGRTDTQRRVRNHLSQLAALGYRVTVEPAA
jgi:transposase